MKLFKEKNRPFDARKSLSASMPVVQSAAKNSRKTASASAFPQFPQVSMDSAASHENESSNENFASNNNIAPAVGLLDERRRRLKEFQESIERPTAPAALSLIPHNTAPSAVAISNEPIVHKSESCVSQWIHSVDHLFSSTAVGSSEEQLIVPTNVNNEWQTATAECLEIPVDPEERDDLTDEESDIIDHYTASKIDEIKAPVITEEHIPSAKSIIADEKTNQLLQQLAGQVQMMTVAMQRLMERVETTEKLMHL